MKEALTRNFVMVARTTFSGSCGLICRVYVELGYCIISGPRRSVLGALRYGSHNKGFGDHGQSGEFLTFRYAQVDERNL